MIPTRSLAAPLLMFAALLAPSPGRAQAKRPPAQASAASIPALPPEKSLAGAADVAWDDPGFARYFRYQNHLNAVGLAGETKDSWAKLKPSERVAKVKDGLAFLSDFLEKALQEKHPSSETKATLKAVWGDAAAAGVLRVVAARLSQDPRQVELALKSAQSLVGKAAGAVDWNALFDGTQPDAEGPTPATKLDPLALKQPRPFLESLASAEVTQPLSSRKTFESFLSQHAVASAAVPPLLALYDVVNKAGPVEKKELSHILPTVVRFLQDGKPIVLEQMEGAYGFAVPGPFDSAEKVGVTPAAAKADPLAVASTLAHEFQHVYDMYTGRYYSLDSELRGFKTSGMFFKALVSAAPNKVAEMKNSDNNSTRAYALRAAELEAALAEGPRAFGDRIAFGQGYNHFHGAVFSGRLPLREAVDERLGAPRQLAAVKVLREKAQQRAAALESRQTELRALSATSPSRETDKELEKAARDLENARDAFSAYDREVTLQQIRINRMRSELSWLDRKNSGKKDPEPYDLHLQVDASYVTP